MCRLYLKHRRDRLRMHEARHLINMVYRLNMVPHESIRAYNWSIPGCENDEHGEDNRSLGMVLIDIPRRVGQY
jgi:hypothetical protein